MRKQNRTLLVISSIALAIGGIALLVFAFLPSPRPFIWYWKEGRVYRFDVENKNGEIVDLPQKDRIFHARLSYDTKSLAFTDTEGLKIFSLNNRSSRLLIPREFETRYLGFDIKTPIDYLPLEWSPDGKWIVSHYSAEESDSIIIVSSDKGKPPNPFESDLMLDCATGYSWSPDSQFFIIGRYGFGGFCYAAGGIVVVPILNPKNSHRIYFKDVRLGEKDPTRSVDFEGGITSLALTPHTKQIAFAQIPSALDDNFISQIGVIDQDGKNLRFIYDSDSKHAIESLIWSSNGKKLYFSKLNQTREVVGIFSLEISSGKTFEIYSSRIALSLSSLSPDDKWLSFSMSGNLWLLNLTNNETIQLPTTPSTFTPKEDRIAEIYPSGFAGWEMTTR